MTASAAMSHAPCSCTPGRIVTSGAMTTSASIHVVSGSTTVTPARMCASTMRRLSSRPSCASWTRSLAPSTCHTSSVVRAATREPAPRAIPMTSVKYFSPCALSVLTSASALRSTCASKA